MAASKTRKTKSRRRRQSAGTRPRPASPVRQEIIGIALIGLAVLLFVVLRGEDGGRGIVGGMMNRAMVAMFGRMAVLFPVIIAAAGVVAALGRDLLNRNRIWGLAMACLVIVGYAHRPFPGPLGEAVGRGLEGAGGGAVGGAVSGLLVSAVGALGRDIVLTVGMVMAVVLVTNFSLFRAAGALFRHVAAAVGRGYEAAARGAAADESDYAGESAYAGVVSGTGPGDEPGGSRRRRNAFPRLRRKKPRKDADRPAQKHIFPSDMAGGPAGLFGPAADDGDETAGIPMRRTVIPVEADDGWANSRGPAGGAGAGFGPGPSSEKEPGAGTARAGAAGADNSRAADAGTGAAGGSTAAPAGMPSGDTGGRGAAPAGAGGKGGGDAPLLSSGAPAAGGLPPARPYRLPPLSLLNRGRGSHRLADDGRRRARLLEETLDSFGVAVRVIGIEQGPAVTRFELELARGVKVSRVQNLANDIALSLAATDVRIEAPIPGKAAVGIEVPNREISPVTLREVLESPQFRRSKSPVTFGVGKDIAGHAITASLNQLPHVLIAGATGSGKSVCINALLTSLLFKARPDEVRLMLIDPKVVELSSYNGLPHLLIPVITDARRAAASLQWLVKEMERRYEAFAAAGVRDIDRYNARAAAGFGSPGDDGHGEGDGGGEGEHMPYIVVVIDELADLMMVSPVEVEDAIQRLAQMARAAGIHMVVATQRPSVDVITGVIKANIPSRIAFSVSSQTDSRVILDAVGAEKLVGKGDMLFFPMGASKPVRVQGCYVSEKELEAVLGFIREQADADYVDDILEASKAGAKPESASDELFPDAVREVVEAGQASVSLLQRRLRVGYTRAGRLIDMMEERGFIGPHLGSKPRELRISRQQYEQMFGEAGEGEADAPPP